jgi:hypothetical protein
LELAPSGTYASIEIGILKHVGKDLYTLKLITLDGDIAL